MLAISDTRRRHGRETQNHIFEPFYTTKMKGTAPRSLKPSTASSAERARVTSGYMSKARKAQLSRSLRARQRLRACRGPRSSDPLLAHETILVEDKECRH